jgi:hypothetical protein
MAIDFSFPVKLIRADAHDRVTGRSTMNNPVSNRMLALGLAMLFLLPGAIMAGAGEANGGTNAAPTGRAGPDHNGSVSISNFSGCHLDNVVIGTGGGPARLQKSEGYYATVDFPLVSTAEDIYQSGMVANSRGEFIAAWDQWDYPTSTSVHVQRFNSSGALIGGQIIIVMPGYLVSRPAIAVNSKDEIILGWTDNSSGDVGTDGYRAYVQKYDRNGTAIGSKIVVSTNDGPQQYCAIAVDKDDNFLVAWADYISGNSIVAQWFDPSGNKLKGLITVSDTSYSNILPQIAIAPNGGFAIVWVQGVSDPPFHTNLNVWGQWFDSGSNKLGANMPIHVDNTTDMVVCPRIASDPEGNFLVAWNGQNKPSPNPNVYTQWFDSGGNKLPAAGAVFLNCNSPFITMRPDGGYLLAYTNCSASNGPVVAQGFLHNGTRHGDLVTLVSGTQYKDSPVLTMVPGDDFMALWFDQRNSQNNLYARFFYHPFAPSGSLVTGELAPSNLFSWSSLEATSWLNPSKSSLAWGLSTDNGTTWQPLPANGSLAAAGPAPAIRIKADFGTTDNSTSPVLDSLGIRYVTDSLPLIGDHANLIGWKRQFQTIPAAASDSDGDPLTYNWSQAGGPPAALENASSATLGFTPGISGDYVFQLVVGDGIGQSVSPPIHFLVGNRPPVAILNASASSASPGAQLAFNASGSSDADDNISAYNFRFGDGSESGWGPNATSSHAYASAGSYNATVSVRDNEGNESTSPPLVISVAMNNLPRLALSGPTEGQTVNTTSLAVTFTVENFAVTQTGGHIHYQLDTAGEVMWFSTSPFTLNNLTDGKHLLKVYLADANHTRLSNPEAYVQVNFTVQLPPLPDLAITGSDIKLAPQSPKEGETVTITATIYNSGQVDAGTFTVRFLVDGTALPDLSVVTLGKGANIVREATWKAKAGPHAIKVVIDPAGSVSESAKANNEASINISVPKKSAPAAGFPWLVIAVVLVVVVAAAAAAVMLMRRKKPATVIQYQPPPMPPAPPSTPPVLPPQAPPPIPPPS